MTFRLYVLLNDFGTRDEWHIFIVFFLPCLKIYFYLAPPHALNWHVYKFLKAILTSWQTQKWHE